MTVSAIPANSSRGSEGEFPPKQLSFSSRATGISHDSAVVQQWSAKWSAWMLTKGSKNVFERTARDKKILETFSKNAKIFEKKMGTPIDIVQDSGKNFRKLIDRLRSEESSRRVEDLFGCHLPKNFSGDISEHANRIFEENYLQPFGAPSDAVMSGSCLKSDRAPIQRPIHGAMHASRVAIWILAMTNLYRTYGDESAMRLTQEDVLLLQIAALFHDAARQDDGKDIWDRQSGGKCYKYLLQHGIDEARARLYSNAIISKDTPGVKTIIHKLIHDADCLDIIRCKESFEINYMDFYRDVASANEGALNDLIELIHCIRSIIHAQSDLFCNTTIVLKCYSLDASVIFWEGLGHDFSLEKKKQYEHADNCYHAILADVSNCRTLSRHINPVSSSASRDVKSVPERAQAPLRDSGAILGKSLAKRPSDRFQRELSIIKKRLSQFVSQYRDTNLGSILSCEEKVFLETFLGMNFYLVHVTSMAVIDQIALRNKEVGHRAALRGASERNRYRESTVRNSLPVDQDWWGMRDYVFFGISSQKFRYVIPRFNEIDDINNNEAVVIIDIKKFINNNPGFAKSISSRSHLGWYVGWADYSRVLESRLFLGNTDVTWRYGNTSAQNPFFWKAYKDTFFQDENGSRLKCDELGDAVFTGPHLWISIGLSFIDKIRALGETNPLKQFLFRKPDEQDTEATKRYQEIVASTFQEFFPPDDFEVTTPLSVVLNDSAVTILHYETNSDEKLADLRGVLGKAQILSKKNMVNEVLVAVESRDRNKLKELIRNGYPLDGYFYKDANTLPLVKAIEMGDEEGVRFLIEHGANRKCFNNGLISEKRLRENEGISAPIIEILEAATKHPHMFEILMENKFDYFVDDFSLRECVQELFRIAHTDNTIMLEFFLRAILKRDDTLASRTQTDIEAEKRKCIQGYVNAKNFVGTTPLCFAICNGRLAMTKRLIELGADVRLRDDWGYTALHVAAQSKDLELIRSCVSAVADKKLYVNTKNFAGITALEIAVRDNNFAAVCELLQSGAEAQLVDSDTGSTLLHWAVTDGADEVIELLVHSVAEKESYLNATNSEGDTALHLAVKRHNISSVRTLIRLGAKIDSKALLYASSDFMTKLLEKEAQKMEE